jgi:hypothetical protein
LDISRACDNVFIDILCGVMLEKELPLGIVQFVWSMMCKTLVFCVRGAECMTLSGYKGLLKDSILSPLLYNLLGSGIDRFVPSGSDSLQYADDIVGDLWFHWTYMHQMCSDFRSFRKHNLSIWAFF